MSAAAAMLTNTINSATSSTASGGNVNSPTVKLRTAGFKVVNDPNKLLVNVKLPTMMPDNVIMECSEEEIIRHWTAKGVANKNVASSSGKAPLSKTTANKSNPTSCVHVPVKIARALSVALTEPTRTISLVNNCSHHQAMCATASISLENKMAGLKLQQQQQRTHPPPIPPAVQHHPVPHPVAAQAPANMNTADQAHLFNPNAENSEIRIVIIDENWSQYCYRIKLNTQFGKLINRFCQQVRKTDNNSVLFWYHGKLVEDEDTPKSLKIKDGEVILAHYIKTVDW